MPLIEEPPALQLDPRKTYLVVDDFETMRKVTINQLMLLGAKNIVTAKDGSQALSIMRKQKIDVVLSDWNMPVMSGIEFLREVRADEKLYTVPFIMITAEAERQRVETAVACGVSAMLLKPYSPNQLGNRLGRALTARHRRMEPQASAPGAVPSQPSAAQAPAGQTPQTGVAPATGKAKMTVLVVDDTPDNLTLLSGILKGEFRVLAATSGAKALEICSSDEPPDLVLLDVMMPEMDGFEVARRMREHPNSESTPVIFVTALTTNEARNSGLELGAVDFLTKPVDPPQLLSRVRNFMRYVQLRKSVQSDFDNMVEMARMRDEVDHMTRHDIKGPLAGALGLVQGLMRESTNNPAQVEQLALIEETVNSILSMVNLSSELLKIETGTYTLNANPVPLMPMVQSAVELQQRVFSSKNVTVDITPNAEAASPVSVLGDSTLCYSAVQNLLKNAFEASPEGGKITLKVEEADPVRLTIQNHGTVPAGIRDRFFEKYVTSDKAGGTGMGTYSARLLCRAQRGDVELAVDDAANTTTLVVTLPKAPAN